MFRVGRRGSISDRDSSLTLLMRSLELIFVDWLCTESYSASTDYCGQEAWFVSSPIAGRGGGSIALISSLESLCLLDTLKMGRGQRCPSGS